VLSPDRPLVGDTRYVNSGCNAANIPQASAGVTIAVTHAFNCTFQQKAEQVELRGYRGLIMFAPSNAEFPPLSCDQLTNLLFANYTGNVMTLFVSREVGFRIMGLDEGFTCGGQNPTPTPTAPAAGIEGNPVDISAAFDGWGYTHLYRNTPTDLEAVDHFAIEEAKDERYSRGFGDLSVHEFATDPEVNLAYSSYYSGGLRVMSFGPQGLAEVGKYIDQGGNNFWGVEQFTAADGGRMIAMSDRDYGLYILRYTGPGAVLPPEPAPAPTGGGDQGGVAGVQVASSRDATRPRISLLSAGKQRVRVLRSGGLRFQMRFDEAVQLEVSLLGRLRNDRGGRSSQRKLASTRISRVGANETVTVTLRPSARLRQRLRRERRMPGVLQVKAVDAAGNAATRVKSLSFR
jgi:hypothetical protein